MNPTIETEIAVIKEQLKYVIENIDSIKNNHLNSIYNRLGVIEKKIAYYFGAIAAIMVVADILLRVIMK